ncbi:ABC-2 transporter permease [Acidobacteriota bacterium]
MLRLIQKNSFIFFLYSAGYMFFIFPLMNYTRYTSNEAFDPIYIFYQAPFIFWVVLGAIWTQENLESKIKGYSFLNILPITVSELVISKFSVALMTVCVYELFQWLTLPLFSTPVEYIPMIRSYLVLYGGACLIFSGLFFLGLFKFGFTRINKFMFIFWILLFLSPLPIREFLAPKFDIDIIDIIRSAASLNWALVTVVSLFIYSGLMMAAIKTKSAQRE